MMMYKKILFLALMPWSCAVSAQQTIYYDRFFQAVSEKPTTYSRTLENDGAAVVFIDMRRDTVLAKGRVNVGKHPDLALKMVEFVKGDCNPYKFKEEFKSMRCDIDVYNGGKLYRRIISHDAKMFYGQIWDDAGTPVLTNGNGIYTQQLAECNVYEYYADSVLSEQYTVRLAEKDTIYGTYDKAAMPEGGYQRFVQELTKYIKYPGAAQINRREARIYIQFVVDKTGKLTEFKPLNNTGYNFEEKTVKRMEKLSAWEPAVFRGKPVKTKFVLPIHFKLS